MKKLFRGKNLVVFFDFDNTITTRDILDDILVRFSRDDRWRGLEEEWERGDIGSRACLRGQLEGVRISKDELDKYLLTVEIDPYFKKLLGLLKSVKSRAVIVTDNFDYILRKVLKNNGISSIEAYANALKIDGDRLNATFPLTNASCGDCGHCKKTSLVKRLGRRDLSAYVGDGRSDICAARQADMVFAKDYLKQYFKDNKLPHIPIDGLKGVYAYLEENTI